MILIWYHYADMKLITRDTDYAVRTLLEKTGCEGMAALKNLDNSA
jgi:hypothetical protein